MSFPANSSTTSVENFTLSYTWVIDNFLSYFNAPGFDTYVNKYSKVNKISTELFGDDNVKMQLECYPIKLQSEPNEDGKSEMYLAVHLILHSKKIGNPVFVEITCLRGDSNDGQTSTFSDNIGGTEMRILGKDDFIKKDEIINNGFIVDGKLSIYCKAVYIITETNEVVDNSLIKFGRNEKSCDISIVAQDHRFPVHKFLLLAYSPYFSRTFQNLSKEQQGKIDIIDFEANVVEAALNFMYSGDIKLVTGLESALLAVADKWEMGSLKASCEQALCAKISANNVGKLIALADTHHATFLKSKALDYFKNNLYNFDEEVLVELIRKFPLKRAADELQNENGFDGGAIDKKLKN